MKAYSELYLSDIVDNQGEAFLALRDELPSVDEKWFIEKYMQSHVRAMLDIGNIKFANMPSRELIKWFIEEECNNEYERGEQWGGFIPEWAGKIYAMYQWEHNVKSKDLIKILPLSKIEEVFPALHQASWSSAVDKIHGLVKGA